MTAPKPNHGTRNWRKVREAFRTQCATTNEPCWLCGQPIDYGIDHGEDNYHPDAFEPDHFHTRKHRPELAEDPANLRASHASCNRTRGDTDPTDLLAIGAQSRTW